MTTSPQPNNSTSGARHPRRFARQYRPKIAAMGLAMAVHASWGCGSEDSASQKSPFGHPGLSASDTPRVVFMSPQYNESVAGQLQIRVRVEPPSAAEMVTTLEVVKLDLLDTNPAAHEFEAEWDTHGIGVGPFDIQAVAELVGGQVISSTVRVIITKPNFDEISGHISLVGPLAGTTVQLVQLDDRLEPAELLASTVSKPDGSYTFANLPPITSPMLMVQALTNTGAHHLGPEALPEYLTLRPRSELSVIFDANYDQAYEICPSPWTTMATSLARALVRRSPSKPPAQAVNEAHLLLGDHLWRPHTFLLAFGLPSFPWQPAAFRSHSRTQMMITHMGLAELAAKLTKDIGTEVHVIDLIDALANDLRDGLFDGLQPAENGIHIEPVKFKSHTILTVDTTRNLLAEACYRATEKYGSPVQQAIYLAPGGLYHNMATDTGPLYPPASPPPPPIAPEPPWATFVGSTPAHEESVRENFSVHVQGSDNVGLVSLALQVGTESEPLEFVEPPQELPSGYLGSYPASVQGKLDLPISAWPAEDGPLPLTLVATDAEGASATAERTIWLDRQPPKLMVLSPGANAAVNTSPVVFIGEASDEPPGPSPLVVEAWKGPVGSRPLQPSAVTPNGNNAFAIEVLPEAEGTAQYTVRARDAAGHTATEQLTLTFDITPPEIALLHSPQELGLWSSTPFLRLRGTLADYLSGPAHVVATRPGEQKVAVLSGSPGLEVWELDVPVSPLPTPWAIEARDRAGNMAPTIQIVAGLDTDPPEVHLLQPQSATQFTNQPTYTLHGHATDYQSGVKAVMVKVGELPAATATSLLPTGEPGQWLWSFAVTFPTAPNGTVLEGPTTVQLWAEDVAGHQSAHQEVTFVVDTTPPTIGLKSEIPFVDEQHCTLNSAGGVNCDNPTTLSASMQARCKQGNCGVLSKYLHRWGHDAPPKPLWDAIFLEGANWPTFPLIVQDTASSQVNFQRRFVFANGSKSAWAPVDLQLGVSLALPEFAPALKTLPNPSTPFPVALELEAMDLAGNVAEQSFAFELRQVAPSPLAAWSGPSATAQLSTGGNWSLASGQAHLPFEAGSQSGVLLGTLTLTNPLNYPIAFVPSAEALVPVEFTAAAQRRWGPSFTPVPQEAQNPADFGCGEIGLCRHFQKHSPATWSGAKLPSSTVCSAPVHASQTVVEHKTALNNAALQWLIQVHTPSGTAVPAQEDGAFPIPAKGQVVVRVSVAVPGTCLLEPPVDLPFTQTGTHSYLRPSLSNCVNTSAAQGALDDFAWCTQPQLTDPLYCSVFPQQCVPGFKTYRLPYIVNQVALASPPGNPNAAQWRSSGRLTGFSGVSSTEQNGHFSISRSSSQSLQGSASPW